MIELAAAAEAAALRLADRLHLRALGPGAGRQPASPPTPSALAAYLGKLARRRLPARPVRDLDRQDARVPRAGVPGRRADARPARHAAAVRVAELLDEQRTVFDVAHMLAGGLVLVSFMLLYQDRMFGAAQRVRAARRRAVGLGRLAGATSRTRRISTSRPRSRSSSRPSSFRVALHRIVVRLGIHRTIETVVGIGPTMLAGMGLVALSMVVMLRGHGRRPTRWRARTWRSRCPSCCSAC